MVPDVKWLNIIKTINIVSKPIVLPIKLLKKKNLKSNLIEPAIKHNKSSGKIGYGFDAYNEVFTDMIEAGIVDPAKVTRSALQNASSVASMVLTTEAVISDKKEENPAPAMPAGGMGGMY